MSETQRKDSSEKQAWEHIAPELPPEWSIRGMGADMVEVQCREGAIGSLIEVSLAAGFAWQAFGTPQKSWAKLIAPGLVREAAEKALGDDLRCVEMSDEVKQGRGACFIVYAQREDEGWPREHFRGHGPTICDAAWACIQALGGGE